MWNPNALCDSVSAQERAEWLVQNKGMSQMGAQQQVMSEFPQAFGGMGMGGMGMGGMGMGGMGMGGNTMGQTWNPGAMCDGSMASERAEWLMNNEGMSMLAAQQRIMSEFPHMFQGGMQTGMPMQTGMGMGMPMQTGMAMGMGGMGMATGGMGMGGMGMKQPCFKCQGKGFAHDSSMDHDKGPMERCFFCKNCTGCGGSGYIGGGGGMGMGMGGMAQACFKCQGKGFCHDSSMTHDKGPMERCFFCKNCDSCGGSGNIGGGGMGTGMGMPMGGNPYANQDMADTCKNCTIL